PKAISIGTCADEFDTYPVSSPRIVAQKQWRTVENSNQKVFSSAIEEVSSGRTAGHIATGKGRGWPRILWGWASSTVQPSRARQRPYSFSNLFELAVVRVIKQKRSFGISNPQRMLVHLRIDVPVSNKNILPAIVVEIKKLDPEGKKRNTDRPKIR